MDRPTTGANVRQTSRDVKAGRVALTCFVLGLLALYLSVGCAHATSLKVAQGAFVGASVADLHSTQLALAQGHTEKNPLMRNGVARVVSKAAAVAVVLYVGQQIEQRGGGTLARVLTTAAAVGISIITIRNYNIAGGVR